MNGPLKQQIISIKPMGAKMSFLPSIVVIFFPCGGLHVTMLVITVRGNLDEKEPCGYPFILPSSSFTIFLFLTHHVPCFLLFVYFFPFQTLSYFQHDMFSLQLGRGWAAPRLIRVVWLYGPMWTHWRARTHTFDMDETRSQPMWINLTTLYARKDASQA